MLPLLLSLALLAADPPPPPAASPIRLPVIGRKADPTPTPAADAPVPFPAGQVYAFDSPVKCQVRSYPGGCLAVAEKKGPRDITARFVGGTGDDEDRSFEGPFVYLVRATRAGCVELVVTPYGFTKDEEVRSVKFDVLAGCKADPAPGPTPPLPTPADPLFDAVQAAFGADGSPTKQADRTALAAVYAAVAAQVKDPAIKTEADLAKVIADARAARVGTRLSAVREIIGREFGKARPADATATLTDADREAVRAALTRFATLLEAVK